MSYLGDFKLGDTLDFKFVTTAASTGAPTTLSGSPVISAYPGNSTTELTAGITLTVDFDSRTGLNNVRVVATTGNGYATATNYELVITTGTVGGTSAVGYVVGTFSIENRCLNYASVNLPVGAIPALGIVDNGTAQSVTGTTIVLRSAAAFADSELVGCTVLITSATTGAGQSRTITAYTGASDTATVATWTTTPTGTITYVIFGTAAGSGSAPTAAQVATAVWQDTTAGDFTVASSIGRSLYTSGALPGASGGLFIAGSNAATTVNITGTITTATNLTNLPSIPANWLTTAGINNGAFTAAKFATDAIDSTVLAASAASEIGTAVWATAARTVTAATNITSTGAAVPIDANGLVSINTVRINGVVVLGAGTGGNLWRG